MPELEEGERVVFEHVPSVASFQRWALLFLGIAVLVTAAFAAVSSNLPLPVANSTMTLPLFATCVVLVWERVTFRRHRAWITDRRIVPAKGVPLPLREVSGAARRGNGVRIDNLRGIKAMKLYFSPDPAALVAAIDRARSGGQG